MTATKLLRGQLAFMRARGFEVTVVSSPDPSLDAFASSEGVRCVQIMIPREIETMADARALVQLVAAIRRLRPDIVNASTPKAALLGLAAARIAGVRSRVYVMRGLRSETARGTKRAVVQASELATAYLANRILCVSESLRDRWMRQHGARAGITAVLASGSSNGVDVERFEPPSCRAEVEGARRAIGVPAGSLVVGFVGRLTRDKGIIDLYHAFDRVRARHPSAILLLAGPPEQGDPLPPGLMLQLQADEAVCMLGAVDDPAECYRAMTVLAFPSYREGFPNVPLEAAATGVPTVGYAATGTVDAVANGRTGVLVSVGDVDGLATALVDLLSDDERRARYGTCARARVLEQFKPQRVWTALAELYEQMSPMTAR